MAADLSDAAQPVSGKVGRLVGFPNSLPSSFRGTTCFGHSCWGRGS